MKRTKQSSQSFVSFLIVLTIVLFKSDQSLAQVCSVSCTQTAIARNRPYEEAFEIIQNREWEDEDDFGDELGDLILRRNKRNIRNKRAPSYAPASAPSPSPEPDTMDGIMEALEMAAAPAAAAGLIGVANMVMPMFMGSAPTSGSPPPNFAGPPPGAPGGGFPPTALANPTVIAGTSLFAGLGLIGAGQLVALFDLPRTNDNFAATAGIFEEGNGPQSRRRGKREAKKQIIFFAKLLLWISETIDKGQHKISSFFIRKLFKKFQKDSADGGLYGVFADITLVENQQCNLTPDTCSKFDPFLSLPSRSQNHIRRSYDDYYANSYRRQGETGFSFSNPTCNKRCFRF